MQMRCVNTNCGEKKMAAGEPGQKDKGSLPSMHCVCTDCARPGEWIYGLAMRVQATSANLSSGFGRPLWQRGGAGGRTGRRAVENLLLGELMSVFNLDSGVSKLGVYSRQLEKSV